MNVFPPDHRLFIAMKDDFLLGKDKLKNLKLSAFFILPRSGAIFQKFEGNLKVENNWPKSLTIFVPSVVESQRRCHAKFRDRASNK